MNMDYYKALFTKTQDGRQGCWDSQQQVVRQDCTTSNSVENTITDIMQILIKTSDAIARAESLGTRLQTDMLPRWAIRW